MKQKKNDFVNWYETERKIEGSCLLPNGKRFSITYYKDNTATAKQIKKNIENRIIEKLREFQ